MNRIVVLMVLAAALAWPLLAVGGDQQPAADLSNAAPVTSSDDPAMPSAIQDEELSGQITVDVIRGRGLAMAVDVGPVDGAVDMLLVLQSTVVDPAELPMIFTGTVEVRRSVVVARESGGERGVVFLVRGETAPDAGRRDVSAFQGMGLSRTVLPPRARIAPMTWDLESWFGVDSLEAPGRGVTCEAGGPFAVSCSRTCSNGASCSVTCAEGSFACCRCMSLPLFAGLEVPFCTCQPVMGGGGAGGCVIPSGTFCPASCPICTVEAV